MTSVVLYGDVSIELVTAAPRYFLSSLSELRPQMYVNMLVAYFSSHCHPFALITSELHLPLLPPILTMKTACFMPQNAFVLGDGV